MQKGGGGGGCASGLTPNTNVCACVLSLWKVKKKISCYQGKPKKVRMLQYASGLPTWCTYFFMCPYGHMTAMECKEVCIPGQVLNIKIRLLQVSMKTLLVCRVRSAEVDCSTYSVRSHCSLFRDFTSSPIVPLPNKAICMLDNALGVKLLARSAVWFYLARGCSFWTCRHCYTGSSERQ